jgi:hypothetical protein
MGGSLAQTDDVLGNASSILLEAPSASDAEEQACIDLLSGQVVSRTNVLGITVEHSVSDRLAIWRRRAGSDMPNRSVVVDGRSAMRGGERADGDGGGSGEAPPPRTTVEELPESAEPIDIGIAVARHLGAWESADATSVCCLHSLTPLLQRFGRDEVVSMVTSINELCGTVGATAHHHVDPAAHDEETLATFRPLYDAVVEHVQGDEWTVTATTDVTDRPTFRRSTTPPGGRPGVDGAPETIPMPYSFDQTFDLVSVPRRRTLLYHLKHQDSGTHSLTAVVEAVFRRERSIPIRDTPASPEQVEVSLVHSHLPKLADLGVLDYDSESGTIEYHPNPALESFLRYMETLELG